MESKSKYPVHFALIPDGCRRWAEQRGLKPWDGHQKGIDVLEDIILWFIEKYPTKYITGYGLSIENFNRNKTELEALSLLYSKHFVRLAEDERTHANKLRIQILGRKDLLPQKMQDAIQKAEDATRKYDNRVFNIALAYSGRLEIVDAVKKLQKQGLALSEQNISKNLYLPEVPEPDMILRSSGEQRVSNFLLWQGAYSELFFVDKYWPDVTKEDIAKAMEEYSERKRRFGK